MVTTVYAGDMLANGAILSILRDAPKLKSNLNTAKRYGYEISGEVLLRIVNGELKTIEDVKASITPKEN